MIDDIPGPGTYTVKRELTNKLRAISLTPRRAAVKTIDVPGPGAYTPTKKFSSAAYSIGRSSKEPTPIPTLGPSPGDYNAGVMEKTLPGGFISTAERPSLAKHTGVPGPGAYSPSHRDTSPKYSIKMKLKGSLESHRDVGPGPGSYSPNVQLDSAPTAVIGTEPKSPLRRTEGNSSLYNIRPEYSGGFSFGRAKREESAKSEVPGPGQYKLPSTVAVVPKYALEVGVKAER